MIHLNKILLIYNILNIKGANHKYFKNFDAMPNNVCSYYMHKMINYMHKTILHA